MTKTLIIHIGWHKTATTVLQTYLAKNRKVLREFGICYPLIEVRSPYGRIKHCDYVASIFNELNPQGPQFDVRPFDELFDVSLREINQSKCAWTILSEEGLSSPRPRLAKMMGRYKNYFDDIKIVAYLRRQDSFLESFYGQLVKQDFTKDRNNFNTFCNLPGIRRRLNYYGILEGWAEQFGRDNIIVTPFEKNTIVPDPITHFFETSGLPLEVLKIYPPEKNEINISYSREITDFLRQMNAKEIDYQEKILGEYLMKNDDELTDQKYFSFSDRMDILEKYKAGNEKIARDYLKKPDKKLFNEPVLNYDNCPETWEGLSSEKILELSLKVIGEMTIDISRLRAENNRIGSIKKVLYGFLLKFYKARFPERLKK